MRGLFYNKPQPRLWCVLLICSSLWRVQNEATVAKLLLCTHHILPIKECVLTCPVCQVEDSRLAAGEQEGRLDNPGHSHSSEATASSAFPEAITHFKWSNQYWNVLQFLNNYSNNLEKNKKTANKTVNLNRHFCVCTPDYQVNKGNTADWLLLNINGPISFFPSN